MANIKAKNTPGSIFAYFDVEAQNLSKGDQTYLYGDEHADPEKFFAEYEHNFQSVIEDPVTIDGITTVKFGGLTQTFPATHIIQVHDFITNRQA